MNNIYLMTGIHPPRLSPADLSDLAAKFDAVGAAAISCGQDLGAAVDAVLAKNQGDAATAFTDKIRGDQSSLQQLDRLAAAAQRTRDAHTTASTIVDATQVSMAAVAALAAAAITRLESTFPALFHPLLKQQVIFVAKKRLLAISTSAVDGIQTAYGGISLPEPLALTNEQARGSLPENVQMAWDSMSLEDRQRVLEAIYDDVTKDWDEADRPPLFYYSDTGEGGEGVVPRPNTLPLDVNGAAYRGEDGPIYLNIDRIDPATSEDADMIHTMVHELQHTKMFRLEGRYDNLVAEDPDFVNDVRSGRLTDPFVAEGSTLDEVERIKSAEEGSSDYYLYRPWEVDARRSALEYKDGRPPEKWNELLQP